MNISLPPNQIAFIENLVESGRFASTDDAIRECVQLLISREQLKEQVDVAIRQADRDDVMDHDRVFADLRRRAADLQRVASGK